VADPAVDLPPGFILGGRYRIEELIGSGGFGAVFRATQLALGRAVAVKVILPGIVREDGLLRFQREAVLAQRLSHPNTVRVLDFGSGPDGSPFLVFELLQGRTLEGEVVRTRGLSTARVSRIAVQILKALMEAHALGIVHRDIKPANVFLCDFEGEPDFVKVLDFGIAASSDAKALTGPGEVLGTPRYMAPEQVLSRGATFASDLYALGILMAEALSGCPMFPGLTGVDIAREKMAERPTPLTPEVLASPLGPVIHRATQTQPERRHPSAAEMLAHIEAVMLHARSSSIPRATPGFGDQSTAARPLSTGGLGVPLSPAWAGAPAVPPPPKPRRKEKGSGAPLALFGVLALTCAALAVALFMVIPKSRTTTTSDPTREPTREPASLDAGESRSVADVRPVVLTGSHSNSGWIVMFHLAERTPAAIEYKHPGDADFVSTGFNRNALQDGTNEPLPKSFVILDDLKGRVPFDVRYRTRDGKVHGPFRVIFDTDAEFVANSKAHLDDLPQWLAFRDFGGKRLCYFTWLITERPGVRSIRYGIDSDVTDRTLRMSTTDSSGITNDDELYITIPATASFVTVEITFSDGTTKKKRLPNRVNTP
jgi:serine/threonine-protein kinase